MKENTGNGNAGNLNTGNWNAGDWNAGDWNAGNRNTGNGNAGNLNTGNWNAGDWNAGDRNAGDRNTGNRNTGDRNTGNRNAGDWNAGNRNAGNRNTGDWNTGDGNAGNWNTSNFSSGFLNTEEHEVKIFNKFTSIKRRDIVFPDFFYFEMVAWIEAGGMTEAEKEKNPEYQTTGGYLKTYKYKEAFKLSWDKASCQDREKVLDLPNWNNEVFFEISGIDVHKELRILDK